MKMGADNPVQEVEATSTGSLGLDIALGIGGLPKAGSLKSTGRKAQARRRSPCIAWLRSRKKAAFALLWTQSMRLIPTYARKLGVDLDELLISQPDTGEQSLEIVDTLVRSGAVSMIVVDSVAALTPKSELKAIWATAMWAFKRVS